MFMMLLLKELRRDLILQSRLFHFLWQFLLQSEFSGHQVQWISLLLALPSSFAWLGVDTQFTGALPVAFMKPLSGSGARGLMIDAMTTHGADSFIGRLACTMQGTTDTTFYIVAVYFGSVGIKNTRYSIGCGLLADLAGFTTAIIVAYLFFS